MRDLILQDNKFNPEGYWYTPLDVDIPYLYNQTLIPELFDQNGYDLTIVEQMFAKVNNYHTEKHRYHRVAIRSAWFGQPYKREGAVLNHALLFERKGYAGDALNQLREWANIQPVYYKLINIKPKWGLDFSIDYYDSDGNTLEVLHWEYDGFNYDEIYNKKIHVEQHLKAIDWDDAAIAILKRKDEWYHLDFFKQSEWKCKYFGIDNERWKMVLWI